MIGEASDEKSWPNASSTEHKRSTRRTEMYYMIRDASDETVRPGQVHRQRQACCFEKELAEGQLYRTEVKHQKERDALYDKGCIR